MEIQFVQANNSSLFATGFKTGILISIGKRKKKKGKNTYLKWISSNDPQDRIELRRMQGKIRKMITEEKN